MRYILIALFMVASCAAPSQEVHFRDSVRLYNAQRLQIDYTGYKVFSGIALADIAGGSAGMLSVPSGEARYFYATTGAWGLIHAGFAAIGFSRVKKQRHEKFSYQEYYNEYRTDKTIFLASAGIDLVLLGGGIGLASYGNKAKTDADVYKGTGYATAIQGAVLLIFNNVMLLAHGRNADKWYQIMDELRFTGNSVGLVVPIKKKTPQLFSLQQ